jgi:hypothetical protein
MFFLLIALLMFCFGHAQIGAAKVGVSTIASGSPGLLVIGKASTPKCEFPRQCSPVDCTIYTFIGSGSWQNEGNWEFGLKPPAIIRGCYEIRINPSGNARAVMIVPETIVSGGKLIIEAGKQLIIPGNMVIKN